MRIDSLPNWYFPFRNIREALEQLHYLPGRKNVSGVHIIKEDDLICIAYTNRWSLPQYETVLRGERTQEMNREFAAEPLLYRNSSEDPNRLRMQVPIGQTRLLLTYFPFEGEGTCWNELLFVPELPRRPNSRRLDIVDSTKQLISDRVRASAAESRPCLVLAARVEAS